MLRAQRNRLACLEKVVRQPIADDQLSVEIVAKVSRPEIYNAEGRILTRRTTGSSMPVWRLIVRFFPIREEEFIAPYVEHYAETVPGSFFFFDANTGDIDIPQFLNYVDYVVSDELTRRVCQPADAIIAFAHDHRLLYHESNSVKFPFEKVHDIFVNDDGEIYLSATYEQVGRIQTMGFDQMMQTAAAQVPSDMSALYREGPVISKKQAMLKALFADKFVPDRI